MKAIKLLISFAFINVAITVHGQDSYTPMKMNKVLASLTKSKPIAQSEVYDLVISNKCRYLTKNRSYAAPVGIFAKNDVKKGAKGVDEWVELDKGNSYVLNNYKWLPTDIYGSKQLHLDFDTLICD